ncbi:hypothetical protein RHGRI_012010 [Rhododendron griersonianum]|uniref:F-box associated beta-propeller type 1 domain-containing protein n=1 Tax=Rhododendron griersonianum TaxID=479676 RepID=A0AAV6KQ13_9ERIC|nr:hypothetical protein RHGRI_012010 [Rhododendron griersonianum]
MGKRKREGSCSLGSESELMEDEEIPSEILLEEIMWRLPATSQASCTFQSPALGLPQLLLCFLPRKEKINQLLTTNNSSSEFAIEKINTCPIKVNNKGCSSPTYSIVASCDGLVCILHGMTKSILFWNPLTGETKRVSDPPTRISPFSSCRTYGLGYDSSTDDCKLVWINLGFEDIETGVPEPMKLESFP